MKRPLGIVDTRVKMTDTSADDLLATSFSSVIAFDEPPQCTTTGLDDFRTLDLSPKRQSASDEVGEPAGERGKERRHPRLELDVALDKYHMLDGFAEPLNPQNTPASYSGCNNPGEMTGRGNENSRSRSAPASQALGLSWSEGQPAVDLIFLHGDGDTELQNRKHPLPETSAPSSVFSREATKSIQPAADLCTSKETIGAASALLRCVHFSPPLKTTQREATGCVQRPIPSVERKQDYIPSPRQHGREKWSPIRARVQRFSPYRSVDKIPRSRTTYFNRQADIQSSPLAGSPSRRNERSRSPSLESRHQSPSGQDPGLTGSPTNNLEHFNANPVADPAYDLGRISLSLYQYRMPGTWRFNQFRLVIHFAMLPAAAVDPVEPSKRVYIDLSLECLLFHVSFIIPAIMLRVLFIANSAVERVRRSRISRPALWLIESLWLLLMSLIKFAVRTSGVSGGYYWDFSILYREVPPI